MTRHHVEQVLRLAIEDEAARFELNPRNAGRHRVAVRRGDGGGLIPTLDHLSAGQALLFHLFITILRYADRANWVLSAKPVQIQGIVLIDEIDAHLHVDLQARVLPRLMRLFPRVQFVVTAHSPLFLLGLEREYGPDGVEILDMPSGRRVDAERFAEFGRAFAHFRATPSFEAAVERQVQAAHKPLVLTEGRTDVLYLRAALEALGHADLLAAIDIEEAGVSEAGGSRGSGSSGLDKVRAFAALNPARLHRRLLLLYDCDTKKKDETLGRLAVRVLPPNPDNQRVTKGIENLLPEALFEERFNVFKRQPNGYGGHTQVCEFQKAEFCEYVCRDCRTRETFARFEDAVVPLLRSLLEP